VKAELYIIIIDFEIGFAWGFFFGGAATRLKHFLNKFVKTSLFRPFLTMITKVLKKLQKK